MKQPSNKYTKLQSFNRFSRKINKILESIQYDLSEIKNNYRLYERELILLERHFRIQRGDSEIKKILAEHDIMNEQHADDIKEYNKNILKTKVLKKSEIKREHIRLLSKNFKNK